MEKRRRWVAVAASWEWLWRSMTSIGFEEAERERERAKDRDSERICCYNVLKASALLLLFWLRGTIITVQVGNFWLGLRSLGLRRELRLQKSNEGY